MPSTTSHLPGTYPGDQWLAGISRSAHLIRAPDNGGARLIMAALGQRGAGGQPAHGREMSCTATQRITLISVWQGTATRLPGQVIAVSRRSRNHRDRPMLAVLPTERDGSGPCGPSGAAPCAPRTTPSTPGKMSPGSIRMSYAEMASGVISPS
jgi:hypothetical protein